MAKKYRWLDAPQRKKLSDILGGLSAPLFMLALVAGILDTKLSGNNSLAVFVFAVIFLFLSLFFAKEYDETKGDK